MSENEVISAFAFELGRDVEQLIKQTTGDLREKNRDLEASVFAFRNILKNDGKNEYLDIYDKIFRIDSI